MLTHFKVDTKRDELYPEVKFYQMDLRGPTELAIKAGEFNADELPSWQKFVEDPIRAKGFFHNVLNAIFNGTGNFDELNCDLQFRDKNKSTPKVAMMFLPEKTKKDKVEEIEWLAREALKNFEVVFLSGANKTSNKIAEKIANEAIDRAKKNGNNVLLLSSKIAQRSFSIPEITELYLAYDAGSNGATIQKMSRALTADEKNAAKIGRIVSLSFDPNRDDKFDAIILEAAVNYRKTYKSKSAKDAMRDVLRTVDIFNCTPNGSIKIDGDTYLEKAIASKSIFRVIGKMSNISLLTMDEITALASGNNDYFRQNKVEPAKKGRVKRKEEKEKKAEQNKGPTNSIFQKAKEVIVTIVENIDIIILGTNSSCLQDAFNIIEVKHDLVLEIESEFGVGYDTIKGLFDRRVINQEMVEFAHDN